MAGRDHADYYYVRWSAYAELDGEEQPVVSLSVEYVIDTLPVAHLVLAVGREPTSNAEAMAVEAFLKARPYSKVKIYIKGETDLDSPVGAEDPGFPFNEDVMIFDGYLEGVGYVSRRTPAGGSVSFTAFCVGWLSGLGGSSASTQSNTVKGPGGFDEILNLGPEQGIFDITNTYGVASAGTVTNMWTNFIKPLFRAIISSAKVWGEASNQSALDALIRMDKTAMLGPKASTALIFPVARSGVSQKVIEKFLIDYLGRRIYDTWHNSDLWSVLVALADAFKFAIIPVIDTAFVAPVFTSMGGEVYTIIGADEYHHIDYKANSQGNVTRIAVIDASGSTSNPRDPSAKLSAVVGLATLDGILNPGDQTKGLTREIEAPYWLAPSTAIGEYTRIGIGGDKLAIPDAVNPDAFSKYPDKQYNEVYSNYVRSKIGDDYAKLLLDDYFLARRRGSIEGRFRLDIAPGSTVAIEVIDDKFSESSTQQNKIAAIVTRVQLMIDSGTFGSPKAATKLTLSHIRTDDEQNNDNVTSVVHPIYQSRFAGIKLWAD